ncbi:NAD(P)/FAD-dependent oxidoreductase [Mucilaginibacter sabulilitoris]|uniref:NAD(P)/FAD-dependent oxidoreductase n=1 Tax=Mucilaginibacter sabulilitoris TaxID=1173583 RepID=A0ABZ0TXP2_9SPHI|nr:NAD(P)/FAD-dependent oxidoreductase [Mucilaginibacter sabulilitoris]WPU96923.1 NAD(P)/FAD-dependent oxidoreductase [Mucilaginibacter sabulilitoris]
MEKNRTDYDAVIVGAGPNGLSAAILLRQYGLSVLLLEAKDKIGGGLATESLTLPGFLHDVASAVHPMAAASPYLQTLPLNEYGLEFINPDIHIAHPFENGSAAFVNSSLTETAHQFGIDEDIYLDLVGSVVEKWPKIGNGLLGPLRMTSHLFDLARFGRNALLPVSLLARRFHSSKARGLLAGVATHNFQPLENLATSAIPLVMLANAHLKGWPVVKGGSAKLAEALGNYFLSIGGQIEIGFTLSDLALLPPAKAVLFDLTPAQILSLKNNRFSGFYRWQLRRYRYGPAVYKIDWALENPIPFTAPECRRAGTVHLGNTFEEIAAGEKCIAAGKENDNPFVLLSQPSLFDISRSPAGKHTAYAYCHVPNGSVQNMAARIENQVERFAPGFKKSIIGTHTMNTADLENFNPNLVGGDINSGRISIDQLFTRPAFRFPPYNTSVKGWYVCSAATPPGGGVHGMCGYHAARTALREVFGVKISGH